jgi:hypothetical protein
LCEEYRSLSFSLCSFLNSLVTSSLLAQIFSSTPFSQTPSAYVPPLIWATKFHTHKINNYNYNFQCILLPSLISTYVYKSSLTIVGEVYKLWLHQNVILSIQQLLPVFSPNFLLSTLVTGNQPQHYVYLKHRTAANVVSQNIAMNN